MVPAELPEWFEPGYVDDGFLPEFPGQRSMPQKPEPMHCRAGEITYADFLLRAGALGKGTKPIGAFDKGGYLGPLEQGIKQGIKNDPSGS